MELGELSEPRTRSSPAVEGGQMGLITFTPFHVPCHMTQAQGESRIMSRVHCIATSGIA